MVPFFHTLFTPFSHDFHMHSPSSDCDAEGITFLGGGSEDRLPQKYKARIHIMVSGLV